MAGAFPPDTASDVRRWAENRRIANAVEVRELVTAYRDPSRSFDAALQLLRLWASLHGWPPREQPAENRAQLAVWDRFVSLRSRLRHDGTHVA